MLMDPVNTKLWGNRTFFIPFVKKILFLHAKKSYEISYDPYGLPFIPFLKINQNRLNAPILTQSTELFALNYGHSDILNLFYSNIMHFTRITVGNRLRRFEQMRKYHEQLSETIMHFIEDEKIHSPTYHPQKIWND